MILLKLLISSGLIFMTATAFYPDEASSKLLNYIKPKHYDIKLIPFIEGQIFYGESNISINILYETQHINLYSEKLCISSMLLNANLEESDKENKYIVYKPIYTQNIETPILDIYFKDKLPPGNYTLNIKYTGSVANDGGLEIFSVGGHNKNITWLAATIFRATGARRLFPGWDKPDLKATFNISVMHYNQYMVLSNMPVRRMENRQHKMMWTYFDITPAMSTYLATIIMTDLYRIYSTSGDVSMWCRLYTASHLMFAADVAGNITLFLENEWERFPNISKAEHVAFPNFEKEIMVHLGIILYSETDITYDNMTDPVARKFQVARLVGPKMIKEWFYNVIKPFWLPYWLNEGFATFFGIYAANKTFPDYRMIDLFLVQVQHDFLRLDDDHVGLFTSHFNNLFKSLYHIKGTFTNEHCVIDLFLIYLIIILLTKFVVASIILRMLQHAISEEIFWEGIRLYVYNTEPNYGSLQRAILIAIAEQQTNTNQVYKPDILGVVQAMETWPEQKHYPIIKIIRDYNDPMNSINITIQNFNTSKYYCIPISYTTQKYPNFENTSAQIWLNKIPYYSFELSFKEDGWMIFNIQQTGYYRVNYDDENWRRISNYLNFENYMNIHVLNRAQLIDDAFHFMLARQLNSSIFWNLVSYLERETDYVAWYPMLKALEYISSVFPLPEKNVDVIKTKVRDMLKTLLIKLGHDTVFDVLKISLREEAAKWACILNDLFCKQEANYILKQHLAKPEEHKVLPWWKEWTYCRGLMISSKSDGSWEKLYNMGMKKSDTKFLEYAACSEDFYTIIDYLHLRYKYKITKPEYQEHVNSYLFIIAKHANNNDILKHILQNFDGILHKQVSTAVAITIIINNIYNKDYFKQITDFVNDEYMRAKKAAKIGIRLYDIEKVNQILRIMDQLNNTIESKIKIRCDQIDRQAKYFESFLIID